METKYYDDIEQYQWNKPETHSIIWNDIEIRHILWYCEEMGFPMEINCQGWFTWEFEWPQINLKKSIKDQNEETLEKIYNFIK